MELASIGIVELPAFLYTSTFKLWEEFTKENLPPLSKLLLIFWEDYSQSFLNYTFE